MEFAVMAEALRLVRRVTKGMLRPVQLLTD